MRVAVIGATSFIGKNLVKALNIAGCDVCAVIRENSPYKECFQKDKNTHVVECNLEDYSMLGDLLGKVDCMVYLTWDGTRGSDRDDLSKQKRSYEQGLLAVKNVIKKGCSKVITAGSQAEYGPWHEIRKISETDMAKPNTAYGKYKLKFYQELELYCEQRNVTLIEPRFFSLYGPGDYSGTMIISILNKMIKNQPCDLTECKQIWDFLYIDDAIEALVKLVNESNKSGVYNFGSGESHLLKYYVNKMKEISNTTSQLNFGVIPYPESGMVNVNPDITKLKAIGWKPKITFDEGIRRIFNILTNDL